MKIRTLITTLIAGSLCQLIVGTVPMTAAENSQTTVQVIQQKISAEVAARLAEAGAAYTDLQVTVAVNRDSATPFKVAYRGLVRFVGSDGTIPPADGEFVMNYVGGGQWQGTLAGKPITAVAGAKDNIDLPFVNDPAVVGEWQSVDFVADISAFNPAQPSWKGKLFLKELGFEENGKTAKPWWTWTKGYLIHHGDRTASRYEIKEIGGVPHLFLEWKSGDVTIAGKKPWYYVLTPKPAK